MPGWFRFIVAGLMLTAIWGCAEFVQAGMDSSRFAISPEGIITDNLTGLQWYVGPDRSVTWYQAQTWVQGLMAGGGGWRLPGTGELKRLCIEGRGLDPAVFKTKGNSVWSVERDSETAWIFYIDDCKEGWLPFNIIDAPVRAFAVRSGR